MNEHDLMEALQERVAGVAVSPAPVDSMTGSARTIRRRRLVAGVAAVVVAVVVAVGLVAVLPGDDSATDPATPTPSDSAGPPDGFRYVGLDRAAIAVPEDWPTNAHECATPTESTVLVDLGPACFKLVPYPAETTSVDIRTPIDGEDFSAWTPVEVDGAEALRSPDMTQRQESGPRVHEMRVYVPGEEVLFVARSSVDPERVDDLLEGIVLLNGQAGVPEFGDVDLRSEGRPADDFYLTRLQEAGLEAELVPRRGSGYVAGGVISVDPAPGTVVDIGSTVTVTVARGPAPPGP